MFTADTNHRAFSLRFAEPEIRLYVQHTAVKRAHKAAVAEIGVLCCLDPRPPVYTVSGRIVVQNGPLPRAFLAFSTPQDHVAGIIRPDGTFTAKLHAARHRLELGGLPVGYSVESVRLGTAEVLGNGFSVENRDVSDLIVTVRTPRRLPRLRGRVTAPANTSLAGSRVLLAGPILGTLDVPVGADGAFEFAALPPGLYRVTVPQLPAIPPTNVVVDSSGGDVQLTVR